MKRNSSRRTASARSRAPICDKPYHLAARRRRLLHRLRARRVADRHVWRQLELARPDLAADELPAHRGAGALPPLSGATTCRSSSPPAPATLMNLSQVAHEIARRLTRLFLPDENGRAPLLRRRSALRERSALERPSCFSTSTSAARPAAASAPRTRPAGPRSSRAA